MKESKMKEKKIHNLIIDEEYARLVAPLSSPEYTELEQEIVYNGCQTHIVIWNRVIIKGFSEYEICHRWEIPFQVEETFFNSRDEAIIAIATETLKHKNITDEQYRYCIGKIYDAYKSSLEDIYPYQKQYTPDEQRRPRYGKNRQTISQILGTKLNLSNGTVSKYGVFSRAVDAIFSKAPAIGEEILSGKFHISHDNIVELSKLSKEEIVVIHKHVTVNNNERLLYPTIQRNRLSDKKRAKQEVQKKRNKEPVIKQMPVYDPDAEISSLTLTIPMWISSMNRTKSIAKFSEATTQGLWKLEQQLNALSDAIKEFKKIIEEEYHE